MEYGPQDVTDDSRINFLLHLHPSWFASEDHGLTKVNPLITKILNDS